MRQIFNQARTGMFRLGRWTKNLLLSEVYFGRNPAYVPAGAISFFPCQPTVFNCGLAGLVAFNSKENNISGIDFDALEDLISAIEKSGLAICVEKGMAIGAHYLGGQAAVRNLLKIVRAFKRAASFFQIANHSSSRKKLADFSGRLSRVLAAEEEIFSAKMGRLPVDTVATITARIEDVKDIAWCIQAELLQNLRQIEALMGLQPVLIESISSLKLYKEVNAVLNSIDRLEVRGRDSAGISILFCMSETDYESFLATLKIPENGRLNASFAERTNPTVLLNHGVSVRDKIDESGDKQISLCFTYKVAAEIGRLGDNVRFLREQIAGDQLFQMMATIGYQYHTVSSHTRWASVGAICEANCHPVDNRSTGPTGGIIQACLNGDIDNYMGLKAALAENGIGIPEEITTDTKIIPLQIQKYVLEGRDILEAFRLALNDFEGSHAITIQTDLAPGKLFLAQRGSGQAIFIGLAPDHYISTSEVYGFVEETNRFIKLNGEKIVEGKYGPTQGQIFILDSGGGGGIDGLQAMYYDGTPIALTEDDVKESALTSRDIDRQGFPHYFLKEISEAPASVEKTLQNRWKIDEREGQRRYYISLDETMVPLAVRDALTGRNGMTPIRRIFLVGQGTAGVAAKACADILNYYLNDPVLPITALKASELSGFRIDGDSNKADSMADALVIAITQSGTTTDTNRAIDMVRAKGAHCIAIVNRRDSDITFKCHGVIYTSSGRDIEMSVASTKAFYSQIVAGAVLGLFIASIKGERTADFISEEILRLIEMPRHMRKVLTQAQEIERSARRLAPTRTYWAAVGSGPNKASADEIRIKLSELCYKTISSDYVEDKKHIDLSSEPLIIVCAAGTRSEVLGDIIKDTAIFKAHKASPVVITDEGENRFAPYAEDVFHVPSVSQHLAPILNTLVGHLWGYHAALAINDGSRFLYEHRKTLQETVEVHTTNGLDIFEVILEKSFRENVAHFYNEVRSRRRISDYPTPIAEAANIILLLKYLAGRLPAADFELDFDKKGTALNMLQTLYEYVGKSINTMARPVDAIKHQAKTVTVGTSRIKEKVEGILFDALLAHQIPISQLINNNIIVMKNLQGIVSQINGAILYRISGLNLLGEPMEDTTIEVVKKTGILGAIPSRVESDRRLKGTKRIIVRQGNVYIGKGRKDNRSIIVIPIISGSSEMPNRIEFLLLLNISFKSEVSLAVRVKALGGKHEHIKNIVQENSISWEDHYLDWVEMEDLFGLSAEKVGEYIVRRYAESA
jgi:glutamine---fructose-6-phosphate transaminase (isomerizing)